MAPRTGLQFDGVDDVISVSSPLVAASAAQYSHEVHLYLPSDITTRQMLIRNGRGTGLFLYIDGGRVYYVEHGTGTTRPYTWAALPGPSQWVSILAKYNGGVGALEIYLDGVLASSGNQVGTPGATTNGANPSSIGLQNHNAQYHDGFSSNSAGLPLAPYKGFMDYARFWNTASSTLSPGEYAVGSESGLVLAYNLNAGSGTTAADVSPNGITGTITGATWATQEYSSGLTAVGSERGTTWNVRAAVGSQRAASWDVSTTVGSQRTTTWNLLAPVGSERAGSWNIAAQVGSQRAAIWDAAAAIGSQRTASWDVLAPPPTDITPPAAPTGLTAVKSAA